MAISTNINSNVNLVKTENNNISPGSYNDARSLLDPGKHMNKIYDSTNLVQDVKKAHNDPSGGQIFLIA